MLTQVTAGLGLVTLIYFLITVGLRVGFPLELEWLEGVSLHHAQRISEGQPVYPAPSEAFVPLLYTPGHPWLMGWLGRVVGVGYVQGRVLSILACLVGLAGVARILRREGKSLYTVAVSVGLICSGYTFCHRWFDLVRPDSLYLALSIWGLAWLRDAWGNWKYAIAAGVLMSAAFWTKQTTFVLIVASGPGVLLVAPRQAWVYVASVAVLCGGGVLLGQWLSDGWLWTYIYELHQSHAFNEVRFFRKSWGMLWHAWPLATLALVLAVAQLTHPIWANTRRFERGASERWWRGFTAHRGVGFWALMALASVISGALGYSTQWAESNAFLPSLIFASIFLGVVLPERGPRGPVAWMPVAAWALAAAQLLFALILEPRYQIVFDKGWSHLFESYRLARPGLSIPNARQYKQSEEIRELWLDYPDNGYRDAFGNQHRGDLLALQRPWWNHLAGVGMHVSSMGLNDIGRQSAQGLQSELRARMAREDYGLIWVEGQVPTWLRGSLAKGYRLDRRLRGKNRVLPMTGYMSEAGMQKPYRGAQSIYVRALPRVPKQPQTIVLGDFEDGTLQGFVSEGTAFGRDPARSLVAGRPAVGPHGGQFLLSSADARGGLKAQGSVRSPEFSVGQGGGQLVMLLGSSGRRKGLAVSIVDTLNARSLAVPIPKGYFELESVVVQIPRQWAENPLRLELRDGSERGALFVDDVWLTPG